MRYKLNFHVEAGCLTVRYVVTSSSFYRYKPVVNISSSIVTRIRIYLIYPIRSDKINDEYRRHFDFDRSRIEIVYLKTSLPIFLRFLTKDRKIFLRIHQQCEEELRFVHIFRYTTLFEYYEITVCS